MTPLEIQPEHSPIGASSMYRWSACPGSVRESKGKESPQSKYALEGTAAHDLSAKILKGEPHSLQGYEDDFLDAVDVYVRYIKKIKGPKDILLIEQPFDLSSVHPGCYGISDAVIWQPKTKHLIVTDYKHGAGILVGVYNNPQLKYYALGALVQCKYPAETVEMVIVQPRCDHPDGPIRSQIIDAIDLFDFSVDLVKYAKATEDPNAPLVPGDHCRFCSAAPSCPKLLEQTQLVAATEFRSDLTYDPEKLRMALDSRPAVQAWLKAVDEFAYREAEAGRCPPAYKLVNKRPTRKWKSESEAGEHLEMFLDQGFLYKPPVLKTPAQIEKLDFDKKIIESLVEKVSSGHTLVPESDPREAVKTSAKEAFIDVPNTPA